MSRQDYRVVVRAEFVLELAADSPAKAQKMADVVTRLIFREDFARAEDLKVETYDAEPLETPPCQKHACSAPATLTLGTNRE